MRLMTPIEAVFALLRDEEAAVLSGEFEQLERVALAKQRAVQALDASKIPQDKLTQLRRQLLRNSALLRSAAQGVQDAKQLLCKLQNADLMQMYDREGLCKTMPPMHHKLEHKA
jgi:hypothetical protein